MNNKKLEYYKNQNLTSVPSSECYKNSYSFLEFPIPRVFVDQT